MGLHAFSKKYELVSFPISQVYVLNKNQTLSLQINAMANRAAGKGYENTEFYENVEFQFIGIENIHVMRQSLQKLVYGKSSFR